MKKSWTGLALAALVGIGQLSTWVVPAHAALGETESTVETDRHAMQGVLRPVITKHAHQGTTTFRVLEIATVGRTIREYITQEGTVFGVAWDGVTPPDLTMILGAYSTEVQQATQDMHNTASPEAGRKSHFRIQTPRVVVTRSGHMRSFHGKAYVSALIPQGVTPDEII